MLRILAAAGAALTVVVGAGVYLVVSTNVSAREAATSAGALLGRVDGDVPMIESALQEPAIPQLNGSQQPDFKGAKQRLDTFVTRIDRTRSTMAADVARLRSAQEQLRSRQASVLALASRSDLDRARSRVAAMRSALGSADAALAIERDQVRTLSALMDALDDVGTMFQHLGNGDVVEGIAMFSGADAKLQSAAQLAKSDGNAVEIGILISALRTALGDLQSDFQAIDRGDTKTERALSSKLDADARVFDSLQVDQLGSLEQALLQPDIARYHGSLKAAGFRSVAGDGTSI